MSFASLGQSVLGKTVPSVLGTVFPNTDLPVGEYYICTACYIWIQIETVYVNPEIL